MRTIYIFVIIFLFLFSFGCKNTDKSENDSLKTKTIEPLLKDNEIEKETKKVIKEGEKVLDNNISKENKEKLIDKVKTESKKIKVEDLPEIPLIKLDTNDVKLEWTDGKGKVMTCVAKEFTGNQKTQILTLSNFTGTLYENGKASAKLYAKKAVLDVQKKEIKITTGVKVVSLINKSTLNANKVLWKSADNSIYAQEAVLVTPYGKITGKYMTIDTKLEIFEVSDKNRNIN